MAEETHQPPYSDLEVAAMQYSRQPDAAGLQAQYPFGHEDINGKEVSAKIAIQHLEEPVAGRRKSWKTRRVCGLPLLAIIAVAALLLVGAVVGGSVGGVLKAKDPDNNEAARSPLSNTPAPPASTNASRTTRVTGETATHTSTGATAIGSGGFATGVFETIRPNYWYRIINLNRNGTTVALRTTGKTTMSAAQVAKESNQYWQFIDVLADANDPRLVKNGKLTVPVDEEGNPTTTNAEGNLYWVNNYNFDPHWPLSITAGRVDGLHIEDSSHGRQSTVVWWFSMGTTSRGDDGGRILKNEALGGDYGIGLDEENKAVMKGVEGNDTFWFLEQVDVSELV